MGKKWLWMFIWYLGAFLFIIPNDLLLDLTTPLTYNPNLQWFYYILQYLWLFGAFLFFLGMAETTDLVKQSLKHQRENT